MARVVSGFRKQKRPRAARPWTMLMYAHRAARRLLSRNLFSWERKKGKSKRISPQAYLQRDVHSKRFENPYQRQPRFIRLQEFLSTNRFRFGLTALALASSCWTYVVFFSDHFYVQAVTVMGTQEIPQEDVEALVKDHLSGRAWMIFPRKHLLFLQTDKLQERILAKYNLSSLTFNRVWSSQRLELSVHEKPSVFVYSVDTHFFSLDREGMVIRELPSQPQTATDGNAIPVIYQYDSSDIPGVGQAVLNSQAIASIELLYAGLQAYPDVKVQSFRVRISPQQEIRIVEKVPESKQPKEQPKDAPELAQAAELIAKAQTTQERVDSLKKALQEISVEKLEQKTIDALLKDERVYAPDPNYKYQELEVYMQQGWSLKVGHEVLENADEAERILNIFATLKNQLKLEGEVKEYIDLRFGNRVYYR